jgi:hypothetical protein
MSEVSEAIGRVRRAMPRNGDVMLICDTCEKLQFVANLGRAVEIAIDKAPKLTRAEIQRNYRQRKKGTLP